MNTELLVNQMNDLAQKPSQHQLNCNSEREATSILPDGTKLFCNKNGDVIFADYSNGAKVAKFENYVLCTSPFGEHWFCSRRSHWLKLD